MYTIGEFSKIGKVSTKMLRHYDKIGLLLPKEINPDNGYRYYSYSQVKDIIVINKLKSYRFSLKEIGNLLRSNDNSAIQAAMKQKLADINIELQQYRMLIKQMEEEVLQLENGGSMIMSREFKILKDKQEQMMVVSHREKISMDNIGIVIGKLMEQVYRNQLQQVGPIITKYYDEDFDKEHADIEVCIPVNRAMEGITNIHEGDVCVHTEFVGPYSEISTAYAAVVDYIKENNLKVVRPPYDKYIKGPGSDVEPKDYVTEIYFPVQ